MSIATRGRRRHATWPSNMRRRETARACRCRGSASAWAATRSTTRTRSRWCASCSRMRSPAMASPPAWMTPISPSSRACRRKWRERGTIREDRMIPHPHQHPSTTGRSGAHAAALLAAMLVLGSAAVRAQTLEELASYSGTDRTQRLVAGAKREGTVTLYSSATLADQSAILAAFQAKYGIKVQQWRGSSEDIRNRALTERAGGRFDADVAETAGPDMEAMVREQLLQPVTSPAAAALIPQARMPHRSWIATRLSVFVGAYNTD